MVVGFSIRLKTPHLRMKEAEFNLNILAVDTSAKVTSVAIINEQRILSEFNIDTRLTHSQALMPMINSATTISRVDLSSIDGFAVAAGPGSFTGLRIGIGAIKGMAYALDKPCVSVSTLEALAQNLSECDGIICPVMDARCNQVYTALFDGTGDKITRLCEDMALTIDELLEKLSVYKKNVFFVGDGYDLCYNSAMGVMNNIRETHSNKRYQRAASVGFASIAHFYSGNVLSASELIPIYLRLPQAERELLKRTRG